MEIQRVVKVAVDQTAYSFDKLFTYRIPDNVLWEQMIPGVRVLVPFGRGNRSRQAMILAVEEASQPISGLKSILSVMDDEPLLDENMLGIVRFLVSNTFCTYYEAIRAILPNGINYQILPHYLLSAPLSQLDPDGTRFTEPELRLLSYLKTPRKESDVLAFLSGEERPQGMLKSLLEQGVIQKDDALKRRVQDQAIRMVRIGEGYDPQKAYTKKQTEVLGLLETAGTATVKELCYLCGVTEAVVKNLAKQGAVEYYDREVYRKPYRDQDASPGGEEITLSPQQQQVYDQILAQYQEEKAGAALLHGVTGSGKTQIFLKLIRQVVSEGKQAVMLVPEISLTPQMVDKFQRIFGPQVAVLHSGLSMGEQLDEWKRLKRGEASIAVGTRSAVFAPLKRIGLIIMDEEGEFSYKSDSAPRYHAREVAKLRCVQHNALLLLASATPSIESYYHALTGSYRLYTLSNRYQNACLPDVRIIDLKQAERSGFQAISQELAQELYYNLTKGEQSILLLNRRGYHTFASCVDCGQPVTCPNCSVAMTYHKANGYMMCHYCGYAVRPMQECPSCGKGHVRLSGLGTQKVEDELATLFPDAKILRMDTDTTYSRYAFEKNFEAFRNQEYDIMVGTQMIAKGLDFPNVTLVGVVSADQSLYANDFRCSERTFSLITQVVGRSGRGEKPGRAFIQTYTPENPVIQFAAHQDYQAFYQDEIEARKALLYPPLCDLCVIGISSGEEPAALGAAKRFVEILKQAVAATGYREPLKVLGPVPAAVFRVNQKYRYRIVIKCRGQKSFRRLIRMTLKQAGKDPICTKASIYADVNGEL